MEQLDKQRPTHELTGYGDVACLRWWEDNVEKNYINGKDPYLSEDDDDDDDERI
jgi:hypothetical protein